MGINSVFGSYLDPLADKVEFHTFLIYVSSLTYSHILIHIYNVYVLQVLIGCVAIAMVEKDLLHRK